ncbi:MAG: Crp/Fnr family transcriptional regulator, partial [Acidobacteriota bacterium]|nr:Crp/Fnr family transcriptional regulator [Acidobacteriota bacterium]
MKTKTVLEQQVYLRDVELFQDLTPDEVEALGERMPMKEVAAGTVFYGPHEPTEALFLLKRGRVRLYYLTAGGKEFTTTVIGAGAFFGEMTLLGQRLYGSYAEAVTPCVLCLMSRDDVKTLLLGDLRISYRVVEMLGRRLIETERRLVDSALKHVPGRLTSLLLQLAREQVSHEQRGG